MFIHENGSGDMETPHITQRDATGGDEDEEMNSFDAQPETLRLDFFRSVSSGHFVESCGDAIPTVSTASFSLGASGRRPDAGDTIGGCVPSSVGLVEKKGAVPLLGHASHWLDSSELSKMVGGRTPAPLERVSLLNALAFKCKQKDCKEGQCSFVATNLRKSMSSNYVSSG